MELKLWFLFCSNMVVLVCRARVCLAPRPSSGSQVLLLYLPSAARNGHARQHAKLPAPVSVVSHAPTTSAASTVCSDCWCEERRKECHVTCRCLLSVCCSRQTVESSASTEGLEVSAAKETPQQGSGPLALWLWTCDLTSPVLSFMRFLLHQTKKAMKIGLTPCSVFLLLALMTQTYGASPW